ncbi:MAG: MOSC domain-containing protein [Candidatus Omnitrophota bacterium]
MIIENGKIFSINVSKHKGMSKVPVESGCLVEDLGLDGDGHAQKGIRQVSLLAIESISKQNNCPKVKNNGELLKPGDFAENITTQGIELTNLKIGDRFKIGKNSVIEISKIGKECHKLCAVYYKTGDCIMPREGIFAKVVKGGIINKGDKITV